MEKVTYTETGINYRYFLGWRHKLLAGYLVAVAGLAVGFSWSLTHIETKQNSWIILILGSFISLVFWRLDYRNRDLYHACQSAGAKMEMKNGLIEGQGIYTALVKSSSNLSHSVVLNIMFMSTAIGFFTGGIISYCKFHENNSNALTSIVPGICIVFLIVIAILTYLLSRNIHVREIKPILFLTVNKHSSSNLNCWYVQNGSKSAALNLLVRFHNGTCYSKWVLCNSLGCNEKIELIWISGDNIIDVCYSDIECKNFYKLEFQHYKSKVTDLPKNTYSKYSEEAEKQGKNIAVLSDEYVLNYGDTDRSGFITNYINKELF